MPEVDFADVLASIAATKARADRRYHANKATILRSMKRHGIQKICVTYSGGGDSGCIDGVEIFDSMDRHDLSTSKIMLTVVTTASRFEAGAWIDEDKAKRLSLAEAAETFAYDWLEAKHPGWENNDGADGEVVFDLKLGKVFITHNSHYTETDTSEEEL